MSTRTKRKTQELTDLQVTERVARDSERRVLDVSREGVEPGNDQKARQSDTFLGMSLLLDSERLTVPNRARSSPAIPSEASLSESFQC